MDVISVTLKQHDKSILKDTMSQSISCMGVISVAIKQHHEDILECTNSLGMKVWGVTVISVIMKVQINEV